MYDQIITGLSFVFILNTFGGYSMLT